MQGKISRNLKNVVKWTHLKQFSWKYFYMTESDYKRLEQFNKTLHLCNADLTCNHTQLKYHNITLLDDLSLPGDGSLLLRTAISAVYTMVCVLGLIGNLVVLCLFCSTKGKYHSTINFFVVNLAITDLLFSMGLLFWTVDVAVDYSWPFGWCICKIISLLTAVNVYAEVFFLTAMSVVRYWSVVTVLRPSRHRSQRICLPRLTACLIWFGALLSAVPSLVFSTVASIGNDQLCLLRFPEGTFWLGVHHLLRVFLGFLLPYSVLIISYVLLLHFLSRHHLSMVNNHRNNRVSKSVAVVIVSFCICWFPFNVITFWGILIKFDFLEWTSSFYLTHTYVFPVATCLAYTNSCLNPVIYCLVRRQFCVELKKMLCKPWVSDMPEACSPVLSFNKVEAQENCLAVPHKHMESHTVHSHVKSFTSITYIPHLLTVAQR